MPDDKTIDFVVGFVMLGLLAIGLGSMLLGWLTRQWDRVKHYQPVMSPAYEAEPQTDQTDEDRPALSVADQWLDRLELDRTRTAVVELLVYSGWSVSDIRKANILRGDNALIGPEVEAARLRLGIAAERPREILVNHERRIPFDTEHVA